MGIGEVPLGNVVILAITIYELFVCAKHICRKMGHTQLLLVVENPSEVSVVLPSMSQRKKPRLRRERAARLTAELLREEARL